MEMVHPYLGLGVKRDGMNRKDINFWLLSGNLLDEEKGVLIDRQTPTRMSWIGQYLIYPTLIDNYILARLLHFSY
jgi:hypothetical protein